MAGVERVSVHVSRLAHCPAVFFVEFSRAGSVGNLWVSQRSTVQIHAPADSKFSGVTHDVS